MRQWPLLHKTVHCAVTASIFRQNAASRPTTTVIRLCCLQITIEAFDICIFRQLLVLLLGLTEWIIGRSCTVIVALNYSDETVDGVSRLTRMHLRGWSVRNEKFLAPDRSVILRLSNARNLGTSLLLLPSPSSGVTSVRAENKQLRPIIAKRVA